MGTGKIGEGGTRPPQIHSEDAVSGSGPQENRKAETSSNNPNVANNEISRSEAGRKAAEHRIGGDVLKARLHEIHQQQSAGPTDPASTIKDLDRKIEDAKSAKEKVVGHLQKTQQEIQDLRNEIQKLGPHKSNASKEEQMKRAALENRLNDLLQESASVYRDAMRALAGSNVPIDTSRLDKGSMQEKLGGIENLQQELKHLLNGTSRNYEVKVAVGNTQITAHGLNDLITKLEQARAQAETNKS